MYECSHDTSADTWSIGGKQPQTLTSPILGAGDGLSGSHNKFESDASVTRGGKSHTTTKSPIFCY